MVWKSRPVRRFPGRLKDGAMKQKIGCDQFHAIPAHYFRGLRCDLTQKGEVGGVGAFGGLCGKSGFHDEAQLGQLLHRGVIEQKEEKLHRYESTEDASRFR